MNKRANLYLNIFGLLSFVGVTCFLEAYLYFHNIPFIIRGILYLIIVICGIVFISIELFIFLLLNIKSKIAYITYTLITVFTSVLLTIKIPYSYFLIFLLFTTIKNVLRVVLVDEIYISKEFNQYCKMLGITIRDFKKETIKKRKNTTIILSNESKKKSSTTKKKSTNKKRVQSEATI